MGSSTRKHQWMTAAEIGAAIQSPAGRPDSLLMILEAARIPEGSDLDLIRFAAQQLVRVIEQCPWLSLHASLLSPLQLAQQLRAVASEGGEWDYILKYGKRTPDFFVLSDGENRPPNDALNLIGLLLLIRLSQSSGVGTGLNKTQIQSLEQYIRGRTHRSRRTEAWRLIEASYPMTHRLPELASGIQVLYAAVTANRSLLSTDLDPTFQRKEVKLVETLYPWLRDFLTFREEQLRKRMEKRAQGLLENIGWLTSADGVDGEPPDAAPSLLQPLPAATGFDSLSDDFRAVLATQSTRTRNTQFHGIHPEVFMPAQASVVICQGLRSLSGANTTYLDKVGWILTLLTAATGRMTSFLSKVGIGEGGTAGGGPYLDLVEGVLHLPPQVPPNVYRADRSDPRFEHPADHLRLPLPPELVRGIRKLWTAKPVSRIGKWFAGHDADRLILGRLKEVQDVHLHTREPAALRKWMQCQMFEHCRDPIVPMVVCGDTFGQSDAPLYYHSPRAQELIRQYMAVIWPKFQDGSLPPEDHGVPQYVPTNDRFGAASVVRPEVVQAGFNVLSGQLNISKPKALKSLSSMVNYHQAVTDYLVRRLALVTTQRPFESLYQLTRDNFSLTTHCAVLSDKEVDPEHFTRLVSTTEALSSLISDYLVHLHFLSTRPDCSAAGRDQLLAVCRGQRPLIAYLTEAVGEFGVREGSLKDWDRSTPLAWAGLKTNFHRPFVLNALRDQRPDLEPARITVEVLAQGGHLDTAGHPFDNNSVVAPADFMRPVSTHLQALERQLGLRHVKGFSDQVSAEEADAIRTQVATPPPLRTWNEDLTQHEENRKRLLRELDERVRSKLQTVERQAEEWLRIELPQYSPNLARVIRAVAQSGRKAAPEESRNVVIPDPEIVDVLERIAELSESDGSTSALQVGTHNLLSRRIRAAKKRLNLQCMAVNGYRIRYGSGLSPFLARNLVAVDQVQFLRNHLLDQTRIGADAMPAPMLVAWHLALYDSSLSSQAVFDIATGRLELQHLQGQPGILVADTRTGATITLVGLAALAAGRYSAEQLREQSKAISDPVTLGMQMMAYCPAALRPADKRRFLELLLTTMQVAARVEEPGLLRASATGITNRVDTPCDAVMAFHGRTLPIATRRVQSAATVATADPDASCLRIEPAVSLNPPRDLRLDYLRLLHAVGDPVGFLRGDPRREIKEGEESTLAGSAEIREALTKSFPATGDTGARIDVIQALASFGHHLNDRELRGEKALEQSSVHTYLTGIGPALMDVFGSVDLRSLSEEDFDESYLRVAETIGEKKSASRARGQLRRFHDHAVREFGFPEATIPFSADKAENRGLPRSRRKLLSDAQYRAAISWMLTQLARNDMDSEGHARWRRGLLTASVILVLLRRSGLRINECIWLRSRDVFQIDGQWLVLSVPSHFRRLKTAAGRRLIRLDFGDDPVGREVLEQWIRIEALRIGGSRDGKELLFPHLDNPRHTLGDNAIRSFIQLAFWSSSGFEMVPHELRHLFATDEWTWTISGPWGGRSSLDLIRALDLIRLRIGHSQLATTGEFYIHHLQLLKLQRSPGLSSPNTLRTSVEALATADLAAIDKAWQRSVPEKHICLHAESERIRMAVTRQSGPDRPRACDESVENVPATPVRSRRPPAMSQTVDAWLRAVRTREEFELLGFGLGVTRTSVARALDVIDALAESPSNYRLLEAPTRRDRMSIVPRPRVYVSAFDESMLAGTNLPAAMLILNECVRPALFREGLLRMPSDPAAQNAVDDLIGSLSKTCRAVDLEANCFSIKSASSSRTLTNSLVWNLAMMPIAAKVIQAGARAG